MSRSARKVRADHVVFDYRTCELACTRCGSRYPVNMPVPIDMFIAMSDVMLKAHRRCKDAQR